MPDHLAMCSKSRPRRGEEHSTSSAGILGTYSYNNQMGDYLTPRVDCKHSHGLPHSTRKSGSKSTWRAARSQIVSLPTPLGFVSNSTGRANTGNKCKPSIWPADCGRELWRVSLGRSSPRLRLIPRSQRKFVLLVDEANEICPQK